MSRALVLVSVLGALVLTAPLPAATPGGCVTSCAVAPPSPLGRSEIEGHLQVVAAAPVGEPSLALETLLFHADATRVHLERRGAGALDAEHAAFLRRELERTHVRVAMRVVDGEGRVRAHLDDTLVPLGVKQHLRLGGLDDVQPFETSGTVTRVGLGHLWARY